MTAVLLQQLVQALQGGVISVLSEGAHDERHIEGVELLDRPEAMGAVAPGTLLLAVGVDVADHSALAVALRTAAHHGSALAVKCPTPAPSAVLAQVRASGVLTLAVDPQVSWTGVHRLVSTLLSARTAVAEPNAGAMGGDLFSLANAVAGIVGGAVAIMDTQQVVVAYSSLPDQPIDEPRRRGILGRLVPEDVLADHLDKEVWGSDTVVRRHRPGYLPRMAVIIRAGEDVLGSLWVAFPDEAAVPDCGPTLKEAARIAALHMLALRRQSDADQERRDRALSRALEGGSSQNEPPDGIRLPAVLVGLDETARVDGTEATEEPGGATRRRAAFLRVLDLAILDGRSLGYEPAAALLADRVYLLLPTPGAGSVPTGLLLEHLLDRARRSLHRSFTAVTSPVSESARALDPARRDIDAALDHLRETRLRPGVYDTESLRPQLVLRRLLGAVSGDAALRTGMAERLRAHDAQHATAYAATLLAYLRHFGNVAAASSELHIHENTLRLRLRRAEQLFDMSLADPTVRLLLTLELTALADLRSRP
ncbi:PucR family transcriptional regulator [Streptomyces sp. NPDC085932]|uniref:PucR family transcriptional regulator n=1 Tax=Streptomyces sp. NPDC085932 TaxID=3365741 RepID=UPI0037D36265